MNVGYTTLKILPFLNGRSFDHIANAFIRSVRPSSVRVCKEGATADSKNWRVTVWIDEDGTILDIEQEVEVELPPGFADSTELTRLIKL